MLSNKNIYGQEAKEKRAGWIIGQNWVKLYSCDVYSLKFNLHDLLKFMKKLFESKRHDWNIRLV